jgi:hypothetical protein
LLSERQVRVAARTRPFSQIAEPFTFPEGTSLQAMADAIPFPAKLRPVLKCQVNGDPVPQTFWKHYRPKTGTAVIIVPVPEGGGGLRIALTVAVIAAAIAAPYAAPAALGMGAGTLGGALLSASITIAGMMAINALIPPEVPQLANNSAPSEGEHYAIEGASNRARLKGPVMQVLGRHRIFPDLAAQSYSEYEEDEQYFCMLMDLGYGPLHLQDPRIGENGLDKYDDVDTETSSGVPGEDQEVSLFKRSVVEDAEGREITEADGPVTFTTRPDCDKAQLDLAFRQGLQWTHSDGDIAPQAVHVHTRWALTGTDDWSEEEERRYEGRTGRPVVRTMNFSFPDKGQYDIQIRRTTEDYESNRRQHRSWIELVRSFQNERPVRNKYSILYALRIRASRQLEGRIDDFSIIATTICKDYKSSSDSWVQTPTQNPASLFRHVLQSYANPNRVDDDEIDLTTLEYWHGLCEYYNWTCNFVNDKDISTDDLLHIVAGCGRARPMEIDGKYTVCIDVPKTTDEFHLTPRNCRNVRWRKIFAKQPHALRVSFVDEDNDWKERTKDVYDDGYDENNSDRYEDWEMPGVTRHDLIYKHGRKRLAEIKLRPEQYEVEMDWEWLTFMRGSKGRLSYDTVLVGSGFGRIKEIDGTDLILDERIVWDGTGSLVVRVRCADGSTYTSPITNWSGENNVLTRVGDDDGDGEPAVGDMVMVGMSGRESMEVLVTNIRPGPELSATVTLIPYGAGVFNAEDGPIPPWDALVTAPREAVVPYIDIVTSDEGSLLRDADGSHKLAVVVRLRRSSTVRSHTVTGVQLSVQEVSTGDPARHREHPASAEVIRYDDVRKGETYDIRARYILGNSKKGQPQYGGWSPTVTHTLGGPSLAPSDVTVVYVAGDRISWLSPPLPPDHAGFRVRFTTTSGQGWDAAERLTDGLVLTDYVLLLEVPSDAVELLVKAETTAGVQSAIAGRVLVAGIPRPTAYRVFSRDLAAEGFPAVGAASAQLSWTSAAGDVDWTTPTGTTKWSGPTSGGAITGAEINGGVLEALDNSVWLGPADGDWLSPQDADWLAGSFETFTWEFEYTCPSNVRSTDYLMFERLTEGELRIAYTWATDQVSQYADNLLPPAEELLPPGWVPLGFYLSGTASSRPFTPWRDGLRPIAGEVIRFRVIGRGGTAVRARILAAKIIVMGAEIKEAVADFTLPAGGTRLPLASDYRGIDWIHSTLEDGTSAIVVKHESKGTLQPRITAYDATGASVAAVVDVTVGGY